MKELTQRQGEVLGFITEYIKNHTYPPTIREIADHFSISIKAAHDHVSAMKKKGYLRNGDRRSRTIELIFPEADEPPEKVVEIPYLGTVAAGRPILAEEHHDGSIAMPYSLLKKNRDYFALRVKGDSMEGAGIMDGDTAIIEKTETARNGEIVVALLDDAATLKRFYKESTRILLQPENPNYPPIYTQNARILGRLTYTIRSY
ncbi:transcriptional repressor LexA [Treponema sp. TIM-1]|uniref:transcriptional repressor LexA n=1 Tax=Treponema sp. TIM-1 TaxID=2898417 RepID=UPI0039801E24